MTKTYDVRKEIKSEREYLRKFPKIEKSSHDFRRKFVLTRINFTMLCEKIESGCLFLF